MKTRPTGSVKLISPDEVDRNPDNPRIFFRPDEMDTLMASINQYGVLVPITVYEQRGKYILIDGERRWRCASKLNFKKIPALVQDKPSDLDNLVLMFNIHALREQWDYFTIANKLPEVIRFYKEEHGTEPNETELSELTGLTRGQIRRCRFLLDLPQKYKNQLIAELSLPKQLQVLSEDFFIEMERALSAVEKRFPKLCAKPDFVRDTLITKFRGKVIGNITDFRKLSKIATSVDSVGMDRTRVEAAIKQIFDPQSKAGISELFSGEFETKFDARKLSLNIQSITTFLLNVQQEDEGRIEDPALRKQLRGLKKLLDSVLEE